MWSLRVRLIIPKWLLQPSSLQCNKCNAANTTHAVTYFQTLSTQAHAKHEGKKWKSEKGNSQHRNQNRCLVRTIKMVKATAVFSWYLFSVWKRAKVGWREKMPDSTSRSLRLSSGSMYFLSFSWRVKAGAITQHAYLGKKHLIIQFNLSALIRMTHASLFQDHGSW